MLSVVITSHHDEATCYLTAFAVKAQLEGEVEHEIIIVADGGTETKWENQGLRCLRINAGSPQASRDAGIKAAKFNNVLVLESHVIVSDALALLDAHRDLGGALTFCSRRGEGPELFDVYGSTTDWAGNLWYKHLSYEKKTEPFRIAQFGHSCFIVNRDWYLSNGGYTDLFTGWGGEEPFLCLKAWMLGQECWMVPSVWHAHHLSVGAHGGEILGQSFSYKRNFEILNYVIAGREHSNMTPGELAERKRICDHPFGTGGDVKKLKDYMDTHEVMN